MAVTTARSRPGGPPEYVVIRDTGFNDCSEEECENELDRALEEKAEMIVIEPVTLGEETARWVKVGNCLHKTCVLSGTVCIIGKMLSNKKDYIVITFGIVSVLCASIYAVSWQQDPCCKYQVEDNVPKLEQLLANLNSSTPVVLVRKDDDRRKKLHNFISIFSGIICAWKLYKCMKN